MSKRKRAIKKRKKVLEETQAEDGLRVEEPAGDIDVPEDGPLIGPDQDDLPPAESPIDDSQIVSEPPPPPVRRPAGKKAPGAGRPEAPVSPDSWLGRNKENFLLGLLILYVLLLGLGTVGELFEIEWILNLPLFR